MNITSHALCGAIPPHMQRRVAAFTLLPLGDDAPPRDTGRRVYDAQRRFALPGRLVIPGDRHGVTDLDRG